jgi:putative metallopeptidase DUF4344
MRAIAVLLGAAVQLALWQTPAPSQTDPATPGDGTTPPAGWQSTVQNPNVDIRYAEPRDPPLRPIRDRLIEAHVLEQVRQFLAPLALPRRLQVETNECGTPFRPVARDDIVTLCYELIAQLDRMTVASSSHDELVNGAVAYTLISALAAPVFNMFETPIWGREQDAGDTVAALVLLKSEDSRAYALLVGAAQYFRATARVWSDVEMFGPETPEAQRYFNLLCMLHGSPASAQLGSFLQSTGFLRMQRSKRCTLEYQHLRWAYLKTIEPHLDQTVLSRLLAAPWQPLR